MWARDFDIVGIAMRLSSKIQAYKYDDLAGAILIGSFLQIDSPSADIQQEIFSFIRGG